MGDSPKFIIYKVVNTINNKGDGNPMKNPETRRKNRMEKLVCPTVTSA